MSIDRQLADFEGQWQVERTIVQADGTRGRFVGTVRFTPQGPGTLAYREEGTITLGTGPALQAGRSYIWKEGLHVLFDDGRPFHRIPAQGGTSIHICPPDTYKVGYDFSRWPEWTATWDVSGPRKSYRTVSTCWPEI